MEEGEERVGRQCFRWTSSVVLAWASLTAKEHGIAALPVALLFDVTSTSHVKSALVLFNRLYSISFFLMAKRRTAGIFGIFKK